MRLYDKEKINKVLEQAKGKAMDFVHNHEHYQIDKLKAKFYMDTLISEFANLLQHQEVHHDSKTKN